MRPTTIKDLMRAKPDRDVVSATLLINLLSLAVPLAMLQIFNRVIPNQSFGTLSGLMICIIVVVVVSLVLRILRSQVMLQNAMRIEKRVDRALAARLFYGKPHQLDTIDQETLQESFLAVRQLRPFFMRQHHVMFIDLIFAGVFVTIIAIMAPLVAIIPLTLAAGVGAMTMIKNRKYRKAIVRTYEYERRQMSFLLEVLLQARQVKLLGIEQVLLRRYDSLHNSRANANAVLFQRDDLGFTTMNMIGQISTGLVAAAGGAMVIAGTIGVAELSTSILLSGRAMQPLTQILFARSEEEKYAAIVRDIDTFLAIVPYEKARREVCPDGAPSVTFRQFKTADTCAIESDFPGGSVIAITSEDAGGAGNFLQTIVAGTNSAHTGRLFVGGKDWRRLRFGPGGLVFQSAVPHLLDGSLLENLVCFTGRKSESLAISFAHDLGLDQDMRNIPGGYECLYAGPGRGAGSPAFYQKLRSAAALAREPRVFMIEAAGKGLDLATRHALARSLDRIRADTTTLVSDPCDEVLEVADFQIIISRDKPTQIIALRDAADTDFADNLMQAAQ